MTKRRQGEAAAQRQRPKLLLPVLAVALVAILAVAAMVIVTRPPSNTMPLGTPVPPPYASGATKGLAAAPVTIVEYSDFQ